MRISVLYKYLLSYLLLSAAMYVMVQFYGYPRMLQTLISEREASLYEEAVSLTRNYFFDIDSLGSFDDQAEHQLRERLESLQSMTHARYFVVDGTGKITVDSSSTDILEGQNFNDFSPVLLEDSTYIGRLNSQMISGEILAVIYPLSEDSNMTGYLVLVVSMNQLRSKAQNYIQIFHFCFLVLSLLLLAALLFLCRQTTKPLILLTKTFREYANGHFNRNLKTIRGREYRELISTLQTFVKSSQNINEYQKNFIANVSHDFRSPLTSIKGYTEAMLDGAIPPEVQEKYLEIILSETKRLNKMTESLLELNQYEANGILLKYTTFDINEIIKNAAAAFEKQCTEKRISIRLIFSKRSLFVDADRDKIAQVIQNLLDNAVKFSFPDSSIEIHTTDRAGKVFITISDHGIGIPQENLSHIWDRFYKTDLSRGKDKTGAGLGLSITREIIDAHHEHIHATSIVGNGTDFSFTLRRHNSSGF